MKNYQKGLLYGALTGFVISIIFIITGNSSIIRQIYYQHLMFVSFIRSFFWFLYWYPSIPSLYVSQFFVSEYNTNYILYIIQFIVSGIIGYSIIGLLISFTGITKRFIFILISVVVIVTGVLSWQKASLFLKNYNVQSVCQSKYPNPNDVCTTKEFMDGTYRCRDLQEKVEKDIQKCISDARNI